MDDSRRSDSKIKIPLLKRADEDQAIDEENFPPLWKQKGKASSKMGFKNWNKFRYQTCKHARCCGGDIKKIIRYGGEEKSEEVLTFDVTSHPPLWH